MKILSITAQKPHSTGSGIYLTELVRNFDKLGHRQVVIAGVYEEDEVEFPAGVTFAPAYFRTDKLPFAIPGMSDEMPYESTVYSQMTEDQVEAFENAYREILLSVLYEFQPDLIISHHLFLLTALVRQIASELCPNAKVYGLCHGSDLRQYKKSKEVIGLKSNQIYEGVRQLDRVLALHNMQKKDICETYQLPEDKVCVIGTGYNGEVFCHKRSAEKETDSPSQRAGRKMGLLFAGKISKAKGVLSFIKSLEQIKIPKEDVIVELAGGYGNAKEYQRIKELAEQSSMEIHFLGRLNQQELAEKMNASDIFVLPSFYEGLPLVLMEAMACGMDVVATDLPGVQEWMKKSIPENQILYVKPPKMACVDEPKPGEEALFETRLAFVLEEAMQRRKEAWEHRSPEATKQKDSVTTALSRLTWKGICDQVLDLKHTDTAI